MMPFAKTGGLGDVSAALARYLHRAGCDVRPFTPLYGNLRPSGQTFAPVSFLQDVPLSLGRYDYRFSVFTALLPHSDLPVYFIDCPHLFGRHAIYANDGDEHLRFALLSRASLECCQRMGFSPHVVHANDWHTALLPLYLRTRYAWDSLFRPTRTVLTIHNLAYQGIFPTWAIGDVGLEDAQALLHQDDLHGGRIGFLRSGILYADAITVVSETYAREIQTPEMGWGLDGLLRARGPGLVGIVNGIDTDEWSPETDPRIPHRYSARDLSGKARNRADLLASLGLAPDPRGPVLGVVSRLVFQKGFDLCLDVLPRLLASRDVRLVALGAGEGRYESFFRSLSQAFPGRAAWRGGNHDDLAHLIEAGADLFLMPSLFEPCGLNQMYSQRYGTLPVVRRTGGLADTVLPYDGRDGRGTGFVFEHYTPQGLEWALGQALAVWEEPATWQAMVRRAMARDFSWDRQIRRYLELYDWIAGLA